MADNEQQPASDTKVAETKATKADPKVKPNGRKYKVFDTSCTGSSRKRTHDVMVDGELRQVEFNYPNAVEMPFAHAMKFLREGFIVKDDEGNVVNRPNEQTVESVVAFGTDSVVARLTELTAESLFTRVATLPGGEAFRANSSKNDMVAFLEESAKKKLGRSKRDPDDATGGEMSDAELDSMGLSEAAE